MRKKYNKEDILVIGGRLVRERGYHNTGINDILEVCGIPKGSFYNFFKSKEDFCFQIIGMYAEDLKETYRRMLTREDITPIQRIRRLYESISRAHAEEDFRSGNLLFNLATEIGALYPDIGQEIDRYYQQWLDVVAACILEGQLAGEITNSYPAHDLAAYIQNGFLGSLTLTKIQRSEKPIETSLLLSLDFISKN